MHWVCVSCTTAYSVGAPACPHCGTPEFRLSTGPEDGPVYVAGPDGSALAAGGVLRGDTLTLVGESGPELEVPDKEA